MSHVSHLVEFAVQLTLVLGFHVPKSNLYIPANGRGSVAVMHQLWDAPLVHTGMARFNGRRKMWCKDFHIIYFGLRNGERSLRS